MMKKLIKPLKAASTKNIRLTEVGCVFTGQETEREVIVITEKVKRADKSIPFALADLYNKYPEIVQNSYDPILDGIGHYAIGTIRVYATTLKDWPFEERKWKLGISFYQAVYHLPKKLRDKLMDLTATNGLSRGELRQEVKLLNNGKVNSLPATREDSEFERDQRIYELEHQVDEFKQQLVVNGNADYGLVVQSIIGAIDTLAEVYPQGIIAIKNYVDAL